MKTEKPFHKSIVELSGEKREVNYRFIDEETIEMYADDLTYIGETHYKSLVVDCIIPKKSSRELALEWWKSLGDDIGEIADKYYKGCETIQAFEIEEIWRKEMNRIDDESIKEMEWDNESIEQNLVKPNQKQPDDITGGWGNLSEEALRIIHPKKALKSKSSREQALEWWEKLGVQGIEQRRIFLKHYNPLERTQSSLTGREIEEIWLRETHELLYENQSLTGEAVYTKKPNQKQPDDIAGGWGNLSEEALRIIHPKKDIYETKAYQQSLNDTGLKPNQKQFKEFNPELFKVYINKFSDKDKAKAIHILYEQLPESKLKDYLSKWFSL